METDQLPDLNIEKLYYSIGDVCKIVGVTPHVLRYWETEFPDLAPRKNRSGKRVYLKRDIEIVQRIKELLYDQRFTIEGARKYLKENGVAAIEAPTVVEPVVTDQTVLLELLRQGLLELKQMIQK